MSDILATLKQLYDERGEEVERWLAAQRAGAAPFITTSVDLRHCSLRLVPVDTNLFPAGFNNLSPAATARASRFLARFLQDHHPQAKRVLIIPENHTRNLNYLENLSVLLSLFEEIHLDVRIGSLIAEPGKPVELAAPSGRKLIQQPLKRTGKRLALEDGFDPDLILMNNDMSSGAPELLQGLEQPVLPPVSMGWWRRRKSVHFAAYQKLAASFGQSFGLDPWLIAAEFHQCGMVDFKERTGLDCVADGVAKVLSRVQKKYQEYGITEAPYVFIKADSGTYGMGIMTAHAPEEVLDLNKKTRNKMQVVKEGTRVSEVIIQEGVPTSDKVDGKPAEPMVYMIDGVPVGGMWRVNPERDVYSNLNAAGMEFTGMCDETEDECGRWKAVDNCNFRSFGIVAALAALAAAREDYGAVRSGTKACG